MSDVRVALLRASQGPAALLPIGEAARLLGGRGARQWVEAHVRVRVIAGQRRVLWADVLAASEQDATPVDEGRALRGVLPCRRR